MGKKIVIAKHKKKNGKGIFLAGSVFLIACLVFVWIVQFQSAYKQGVFGDFAREWKDLSDDFAEARKISEQIEQNVPTDMLELNLLPSFALDDRATQQELASSITEEMTKRRYGTLPITEDRVVEAETTEASQVIETN